MQLKISETYSLEGELKELAITNWEQFVALIGKEAIEKARICQLKKKGNSIRKIAYKTKTSKSTVHNICKKCPN